MTEAPGSVTSNAAPAGGAAPNGGPPGGLAGPGPKPEWLKKRLPEAASLRSMEALLRQRGLHTVCESALCPNLGECFGKGTATFLIMGDVCTRNCGFCGVTSAFPGPLDPDEPQQVADAVARLGLRHVVVTSVTRDDLPDGGSGHYVATIRAIRVAVPVGDHRGAGARFRRRRRGCRPGARERRRTCSTTTWRRCHGSIRRCGRKPSTRGLWPCSNRPPSRGPVIVKTGLMVGLGETAEEVSEVLADARVAGVDVVTIGQYLRPSSLPSAGGRVRPPRQVRGVPEVWRESRACRCTRRPLCAVPSTPGRASPRPSGARSASPGTDAAGWWQRGGKSGPFSVSCTNATLQRRGT